MRFFSVLWCVCVLGIAGRAESATLTVSAGGNLQAAIDAAQPGDTILLQAGAVFTGAYTLPAKGGTSFITIRSAAADSALPAAGARITPSYAPPPPPNRATQIGPALKKIGAAPYWRAVFLPNLPGLSSPPLQLF